MCAGGSCTLPDGGTDASCTPSTCGMIGAACGLQPDGCGGYVDCGGCPGGYFCDVTTCVPDPDAGPDDTSTVDTGTADTGVTADTSIGG